MTRPVAIGPQHPALARLLASAAGVAVAGALVACVALLILQFVLVVLAASAAPLLLR